MFLHRKLTAANELQLNENDVLGHKFHLLSEPATRMISSNSQYLPLELFMFLTGSDFYSGSHDSHGRTG